MYPWLHLNSKTSFLLRVFVFILQEGDDSNSESNSFSVENEAAKNKRAMKTNNTSYEMMMGLKANPDVLKSVGEDPSSCFFYFVSSH